MGARLFVKVTEGSVKATTARPD